MSSNEDIETRECLYCRESIKKDALKCKHCGEPVDTEEDWRVIAPRWEYGWQRTGQDGLLDRLVEWGQEGWELVSATPIWRWEEKIKFGFDAVAMYPSEIDSWFCIFKRPGRPTVLCFAKKVEEPPGERQRPLAVAGAMSEMARRLDARATRSLKGRVTIQFNFSGTELSSWVITVSKGGCAVQRRTVDSPDMVFGSPAEVWQGIIGGVRSLSQAISEGQVSYTGNDQDLGAFVKWFGLRV